MYLLGHSAFLQALGWALLNSLLQFSLMWFLFLVLIRNSGRLSPAIKHGIALSLLSAGFLWFFAGLSIQYFQYAAGEATTHDGYNFIKHPFYTAAYQTVHHLVESNLSYLSMIYLVIVGALFVKFARYFYHAHSIQTQGISRMPAELRMYVQHLVQRLSITRKVQIWISELIDTPMVIGFLKPTILIPVASITQLTVTQLEAILLHELAHIKRNDYFINLYVATMEILFFFNPFARLLLQSIKQEREKCCDDCVLQFDFDPHQYASALLQLEQIRPSRYSFAIAAIGESKKLLLHRIQRIMGVKKFDPDHGFKLTAYFIILGFLACIALVKPEVQVDTKLAGSLPKLVVPVPFNPHDGIFQIISGSTPSPVTLKLLPSVAKDRTVRKINKTTTTSADSLSIPDGEAAVGWATAFEQDPKMSPGTFQAVNAEERDFSIPETEQPEFPAATLDPDLPFVPFSSFSYTEMGDTSVRRTKAETYDERVARESLIKAQKALDKIDWNKLGKNLKQGKTDLVKIKKQIQNSLQLLNWQEINREVRDSLNTAQVKSMRTSVKQEYEIMSMYKNQQKQFQQLTTQLKQQSELFKQSAEQKSNELDKQLRKTKMTVYF